jgi:hypothetical protein
MKRLGILLVVAALLTGCAQAAETSLQSVIDGTATSEEYVRAVVTDTRSTDQLLVELTSGDVHIWVTGFEERPGRGSDVWTAIVGEPVDDEFVGLTYPSAGALDPPEVGITDQGVMAVLVAALALFGLLVAGVAAGLAGIRPSRRCSQCRERCDEDWTTCASCGSVLTGAATGSSATSAQVDHAAASARRTPAAATVFSRRSDESGTPDSFDASRDAPEEPTGRATRIHRRGDT